jgi:hypothetical protein
MECDLIRIRRRFSCSTINAETSRTLHLQVKPVLQMVSEMKLNNGVTLHFFVIPLPYH